MEEVLGLNSICFKFLGNTAFATLEDTVGVGSCVFKYYVDAYGLSLSKFSVKGPIFDNYLSKVLPISNSAYALYFYLILPI